MSQSSPPHINRIPQVVLLSAAAALVIFLILLGTHTIHPGGAPTLIIAGALFTIALGAMAAEFEINRTSLDRPAPPAQEREERPR